MSFEGWDEKIPCGHPTYQCRWYEYDSEGKIIPCPVTIPVLKERPLKYIVDMGTFIVLQCGANDCGNRAAWIKQSFIDRHRLE